MTATASDWEPDRLLKPGEVAAMFKVKVRTVTRWARAGLIPSGWTPGGSRRYPESQVRALLDGAER